MIEAINLEEPIEAIYPDDKKDDSPTIWKFKPLSYKEELYLKKLSIESIKEQDIFLDNIPIFFQVALLEPENFNGNFERDEKGKAILGQKPWSDSTLAQIPYKVRDWLVSFIIQGYSEMEKEELKN